MASEATTSEVKGIDTDALQNTISDIKTYPDLAKCRFHVRNKWLEGNHNRTTTTSFQGPSGKMSTRSSLNSRLTSRPFGRAV
ncbi:MAG: hypothetical protein P8Z79_00910 [Sedimentisphaerales bacterium]